MLSYMKRTILLPLQVPSALYLTDVILYLDDRLDKKLLLAKQGTPEASMTKQDLAGREAGKLKKLVQALRYLFRNSALAKHSFTRRTSLEP